LAIQSIGASPTFAQWSHFRFEAALEEAINIVIEAGCDTGMVLFFMEVPSINGVAF
jgi:hypothetical protein